MPLRVPFLFEPGNSLSLGGYRKDVASPASRQYNRTDVGKDREMDKKRTANRRVRNRREVEFRRRNLLLWDLVEKRKVQRRDKDRREFEAGGSSPRVSKP